MSTFQPAPAPVGNCPALFGPDFDFPGSGPNLLHLPAQPEGPAADLVGIGQKSGIYLGTQSGQRRDRLEHQRRPRRHHRGHPMGDGD